MALGLPATPVTRTLSSSDCWACEVDASTTPLTDLGEVVERPGVGARHGADDGLVREARIDLVPGQVLGRVRAVDRLELREGQAGRPGVGRVDDDGQAVDRDLELDVADVVGLAGGAFLGVIRLDRPRRVVDVGLVGAELREAAAGAGLLDADVDAGVGRVELLGDGLGDREDGARAVDDDGSAQGGSARGGAGGGRTARCSGPCWRPSTGPCWRRCSSRRSSATTATIARAAMGLNLEMVTDSILLDAARLGWRAVGSGTFPSV